MRAYEFLSERQLDEGGESGPTRYNTELALCFAFAGRTAGLSKEQLQLGNSKTTLENILKNKSLDKHLDSGIKETARDLLITQDKLVTITKGDKGKINFDKWVGIGCDHYDRIAIDLE